jgi:hypothetical protein
MQSPASSPVPAKHATLKTTLKTMLAKHATLKTPSPTSTKKSWR